MEMDIGGQIQTTWLTVVSILVFLPATAMSHEGGARAHRVHNIVLYPDKHSWCEDTPIQMVVSHPRCQPVRVDNRVCVGTCFSYSVPASLPRNVYDDRLHYCDSCQPSNHTWIKVELNCPNETIFTKLVQVVMSCSCQSCKHPIKPAEGELQKNSSTAVPSNEENVENSAQKVLQNLNSFKDENMAPSKVEELKFKDVSYSEIRKRLKEKRERAEADTKDSDQS